MESTWQHELFIKQTYLIELITSSHKDREFSFSLQVFWCVFSEGAFLVFLQVIFWNSMIYRNGNEYNRTKKKRKMQTTTRLFPQLQLVADKFIIGTAFGHEFIVRAYLDDLSAVEHYNLVGVLHRW